MSHRDLCRHEEEPPPLDAASITVRLGGKAVLDGVGVHVRCGQVTGLLGPNGSGKTTLLHVLAGLRAPDIGTVTIAGRDVCSMGHRHRARTIALVEQHASTTSDLRVRQVVGLGRLPHRGRLGGARDPRGDTVVAEALEVVGLAALADRAWGSLSGGERQRAHLARTLAQEPQVLLLDEPTNHLDLGQQLRFLSLAREFGLTVVAALHDLELAAAYCDDVVVLRDGVVHAAGPVASTLSNDLLADVYGVRACVSAHPRLDRSHITWDGPLLEDSP